MTEPNLADVPDDQLRARLDRLERTVGPLVEACVEAFDYYETRPSISYPGYVWVSWTDLVRVVAAFGDRPDARAIRSLKEAGPATEASVNATGPATNGHENPSP